MKNGTKAGSRLWSVYLSGEIHTDWRARIQQGSDEAGLSVRFTGPVCNHEASDLVGERILGKEDSDFWRDHKAAKINSMRTSTLLAEADVVVVRFGDKYKQWNAAFDAGKAAALGKPMIVLHSPDLTHALKEVDAAANAVAERPEQVVEILSYLLG
jgi:YtoQ family protein